MRVDEACRPGPVDRTDRTDRTDRAGSDSRTANVALSLRSVLGMVCLAYVLWLPVSNGQVLYPLLAVLAAVSLIGAKAPSDWFLRSGGGCLLAVILMAFVGSLNANPGLLQQLLLWGGGLVLWGSWANGITSAGIRRVLDLVVVVSGLLSATIVLYVAGQLGVIPSVLPASVVGMQGAGFDLPGGSTAVRFYGLSTLAAAGPLLAAGAVARPDTLLPSRRLVLPAAILGVLAAVLAGRRAVLVVTVLAPFLYLLLTSALRGGLRKLRIGTGWVLAAPSLAMAAILSWHAGPIVRAREAIGDAIFVYTGLGTNSGTKAGGDTLRAQQTGELLGAWADHPVLGTGLGSIIPGYERSAENPWMFELQYHQLLFNGGVLGVLILGLAAALIAVTTVRVARQVPEHLPVIAVTGIGALGMLFANASNPYLQAVAHWWAIALFVGVVNALDRDSGSDRSVHRFLRR